MHNWPRGFLQLHWRWFRRTSCTSWLLIFLWLHTALLQQDPFDSSTAFCVAHAEPARATRTAHRLTLLLLEGFGHIPAFLCRCVMHPFLGHLINVGFWAGRRRVSIWRPNGNFPPPAAIEVIDMALKRSPASLSTSFLLHLADSSCSMIVLKLAHSVLVAAQALVRVLCFPQPHPAPSQFTSI